MAHTHHLRMAYTYANRGAGIFMMFAGIFAIIYLHFFGVFFCGNSWDSYSGTMELGFTHKLCLSHDADLISARFDSNACVRRVNPEHSKSRKHT